MANLLRVKAQWTGFSGAPGYTVLHFRDFGTGGGPGSDPDASQAVAAVTKTRAFFNAIIGQLPAAVKIQVLPEVDVIESTTGELVDSLSGGAVAVVTGTSSSNYSAAVGGVVNWRTGGIRAGRRIRGRSFIVPMSSSAFTATGGIHPADQATIQTAANTLASSSGTPDLGVYARPTASGATDGQWSVVTSAIVPSMGAVLRSRRD